MPLWHQATGPVEPRRGRSGSGRRSAANGTTATVPAAAADRQEGGLGWPDHGETGAECLAEPEQPGAGGGFGGVVLDNVLHALILDSKPP